jgi:hypothetical protein
MVSIKENLMMGILDGGTEEPEDEGVIGLLAKDKPYCTQCEFSSVCAIMRLEDGQCICNTVTPQERKANGASYYTRKLSS